MKRTAFFVVLGALLIGGCTSYYKVTDPTTDKTYYTTSLRQMDNGAAELKDATTGDTITIQNSHVSKITKEQFEAGKYGGTTSAPAMK